MELLRNRLERPQQAQLDIHAHRLSVDRERVLQRIDCWAYRGCMLNFKRKTIERRKLVDGLEVSAVGYGAMALIGLYGATGEDGGLEALRHALDRGVTFVDTADAYGHDGSNERLVGRAIADRRGDVLVATKWGIAPPGPTARRFDASYSNEIWVDARPERAGSSLEESLRRLDVEAVDLWYLHFPDPGVPIEETVGAMADLVAAGKARHLGLSNVTADELRRAEAIHPIAAVQAEYSLWTRAPEDELLPTARELDVGFVAWGPLGNGFLAGGVQLGAADFRHNAPRFQGRNLRLNADRFAPLRALADELAVEPAQLALAWLLHKDERIVPIPGSTNPEHIDANLESADIRLSREVLERIDALAPPGLAVGTALI